MLTDTAIRKAKLPTGAKRERLFDGGGLYLELAPNGGKWWRWKYRCAGKEKRIGFGTYPETTLADAREKRDEARKQLREGTDPGVRRKAEKLARAASAGNSFETIAREWHTKFSNTWAPSTADRLLSLLENDVLPYLGARPISQITAPELLAVLRRIESRGALETAHRARINTGVIFRYAIHTGRLDRDVSSDLRGALPPKKNGHFAAAVNPEELGDLLKMLDGYKGSPVVRAALRLAPLVFVRPGELRTAKWADIDLDAGEWRYVVPKTNTPHIVPLATQACAILRDLQPLTGSGIYVFPNGRGRDRPMSDNAILAAFRRLGVDKATASGHGFRASARTMLDEILGFPPHLIEHQLAHAVKDAMGRSYNRTQHLAQRREMMQSWADFIDKVVRDVKVLPFKQPVAGAK